MTILNAGHFMAFGTIIPSYASVEFGIKATLAGVLEIPLIEALIVTEPYSALHLKNVAKSLIKTSRLTPAHKQEFIHIVGGWASFSSLRNQIAHCRWQPGERPGSIRPVGIDIRSGHAKWIVTEESRDWTAEELTQESLNLANLNERLQRFHFESGISEIIERKDAERSAATEV